MVYITHVVTSVGEADTCDAQAFNPLTAVSRGSGYKFFVTMCHQPGIRLEHYMQIGTVSRGPGYTHRPYD